MWYFGTGFISMLLHVSIHHFFLCWLIFHFCRDIVHFKHIHQLTEIFISPLFGFYGQCYCEQFCVDMIFLSFIICHSVELLSHLVILYLIFWEISRLFSKIAEPFYIPTRHIYLYSLHILIKPVYYVF